MNTHFLIPHLRAGLESGEFCMWIPSAPFTIKDAEHA